MQEQSYIESYMNNHLILELKKHREQKDLSQRELGDKLGIPQSHISSIENEKTDVRLSTLMDLVRILDLELVCVPREKLSLITSIIKEEESSEKPRFNIGDEWME